MPLEKCYSLNNEDFNYTDIEEALRDKFDSKDIEVGDTVTIYEGDASLWKAGDFAPSDVVSTLSNEAYDNAGEYADDWPDVTTEQAQDLDQRIKDVVNEWADDHGLQPGFYEVRNAKEIQAKLTSESGEYEIIESGV